MTEPPPPPTPHGSAAVADPGGTVVVTRPLLERVAVVESRVDRLGVDVEQVRARSHAQASTLTGLAAAHQTLADDVLEIKATLGRLVSTLTHVDGRLRNLEARLVGGTAVVVAVAHVVSYLLRGH